MYRPQHQLIASHLARLVPGAMFSDCGVGLATGSFRHAMFFLARLRDDGYISAVPGTDRLYCNVRIPGSTYDRLRPVLRLPTTMPTPVDLARRRRPLQPPSSKKLVVGGKRRKPGKRRKKGSAAR